MLRAAGKVGIAQPALSQQISALEADIDAKLLHRSNKGTRLTKSGEILVEHARTILDQVATAREEIAQQRAEISGEVSLAVSNAVAEMIVPPLIRIVATSYPRVGLRIDGRSSGSVQSALKNSRVDLGILPDTQKLTGVNSKRLFREPMCLISAVRGNARPRSDPISFHTAAGLPLIAVERTNPLRQELDQIAGEFGTALNVVAETNSLLMLRSYVESGVANCILPRCSISDSLKLGVLSARRIVNPNLSQVYLIAWPKTRPLSRGAAVVVDSLLQRFDVA